MDACDGLGGGATKERVLEFMRDSRIGTYGAAALGLMLAAKVLALGSLPPTLSRGARRRPCGEPRLERGCDRHRQLRARPTASPSRWRMASAPAA